LRAATLPLNWGRLMSIRHLTRRWLTAACLTVMPGLVHADPPGPDAPPVHIIAVQSDDADDQADALTATVRSRIRALRGFSLGEGDFSLEVLTLALKCGEVPDEACQVKIGEQIHADRYVWGTLKRSKASRQVTADLHLWARGRPAVRTQLTYSDNLTAPGDDSLKRLVDEALGKLFGPQAVPGAAPVPASSASLVGQRSGIATIPVAGASQAGVKTAASSTEPTSEPRSEGQSTAGWAGIGLGGVLIAAGLYSVIRVHDIDTNERVEIYRQGFREGVDPCDQARAGVSSSLKGAATPTEMQDFCSEEATFKTLQYVFFGLGGISTAAGIYLLASNKGGATAVSAPRWQLRPMVARSSARLELRLDF
jgi:hypothetical protein